MNDGHSHALCEEEDEGSPRGHLEDLQAQKQKGEGGNRFLTAGFEPDAESFPIAGKTFPPLQLFVE